MAELYRNITAGVFLARPNRFLAEVSVAGHAELVHLKTTGRCRELLIPGAEVFLTAPGTAGRKTAYDLVAVRKSNGLLVNIDSQAPNLAALAWLRRQRFDRIVPEYRYGDSRIDFLMEGGGQRFLMEVKGCTLEIGGIGYFPDAPTERGIKHLDALIRARREGFRAIAAFVIQMNGVTEVRPNLSTHPAFGEAWQRAEEAGVEMWMLPCDVAPDKLGIRCEGILPERGGPFIKGLCRAACSRQTDDGSTET